VAAVISRIQAAARSRPLNDTLDDQAAFARFARKMIFDLAYGDQLGA